MHNPRLDSHSVDVPLPEELLISYIGRLHMIIGYGFLHTLKTMAGLSTQVKRKPAVPLPLNAAHFCSQLPSGHPLTNPETALRNHTTMPFFMSFARLACQPLGEDEGFVFRTLHESGAVFEALGLANYPCSAVPSTLAWCVECRENDIASHGIAYWHIEHQLPGVAVCATHRVELRGMCGRCTSKTGRIQLALPGCCLCGANHCDPLYSGEMGPDSNHAAYASFSRDAMISRRHGYIFPGLSILREYLLTDGRYVRGTTLDVDKIASAVLDRFGSSLVSYLLNRHQPMDGKSIRRMFSIGLRPRSNMRTLLLIGGLFDSVADCQEKLQPFVQGEVTKGVRKSRRNVEAHFVNLVYAGYSVDQAGEVVGLSRLAIACLQDERKLHLPTDEMMPCPVGRVDGIIASMNDGMSTAAIMKKWKVSEDQLEWLYRTKPGLRRKHFKAIADPASARLSLGREERFLAFVSEGIPINIAGKRAGLTKVEIACIKDEHGLHEDKVYLRVNPNIESAVKAKMQGGWQVGEIRRRFKLSGFHIQYVYRFNPGLRREHGSAIKQRQLADLRKEIFRLQKQKPKMKRYEYLRLWNVRRAIRDHGMPLVDELIPATSIGNSKVSGLAQSPKELSARSVALDEKCSNKVSRYFDQAYKDQETGDRPRWVSKTAAMKGIGSSAQWLYKKKDTLPKTWCVLEERSECREEFHKRLLSWAVKQASIERERISLAMLFQIARVNRSSVSYLLDFVAEQIQKSGMTLVATLRA